MPCAVCCVLCAVCCVLCAVCCVCVCVLCMCAVSVGGPCGLCLFSVWSMLAQHCTMNRCTRWMALCSNSTVIGARSRLPACGNGHHQRHGRRRRGSGRGKRRPGKPHDDASGEWRRGHGTRREPCSDVRQFRHHFGNFDTILEYFSRMSQQPSSPMHACPSNMPTPRPPKDVPYFVPVRVGC